MKKILFGFILGLAVSFTFSAYAEEITTNIIGSQVAGQFPVTINGTKIEEPAAVLKIGDEDKGYLPIRAVSEALGAEVAFDSNLGIQLNTNEIVQEGDSQVSEEQPKKPRTPTRFKILSDKKQELDIQIRELGAQLRPYEVLGYYNEKFGTEKEPDDFYHETKKKREELIAERDTIEKEIADLQAQLSQ